MIRMYTRESPVPLTRARREIIPVRDVPGWISALRQEEDFGIRCRLIP